MLRAIVFRGSLSAFSHEELVPQRFVRLALPDLVLPSPSVDAVTVRKPRNRPLSENAVLPHTPGIRLDILTGREAPPTRHVLPCLGEFKLVAPDRTPPQCHAEHLAENGADLAGQSAAALRGALQGCPNALIRCRCVKEAGEALCFEKLAMSID